MKLDRFILGTYEIENVHEEDIVKIATIAQQNGVKYFDTSICYNNDYILSSLVKMGFKVLTKIPPQHEDRWDWFMTNHFRALGITEADIVLIHNARSEKWKELAVALSKDKRFKEVGVSNFDVAQMEEYKELVGEYPKYNEFEISPYYYPKEIIDFCHEHQIKIIAYTIFGGKYFATKCITDYTMPKLLNQLLSVADYAIMRVSSLSHLFAFMTTDLLTDPKDFSIVGYGDDKKMRPMDYEIPEFHTVLNLGVGNTMPSYTKFAGGFSKELSFPEDDDESRQLLQKLKEFPQMEFITDYRSALRYILYNRAEFSPENLVLTYYYDFLLVTNPLKKRVDIYNVYFVNNGRLTKVNVDAELVVKHVVHLVNDLVS